jgi:uncharacterized protein (TIGR02145 family)
LTITTGNDIVPSFNGSGYINPNPCNGDATLSFLTAKNQNLTLSIYTISGQVLSMKKQELSSGHHMFTLKFPVNGLYVISVLKDDGRLSFKVSSTGTKIQDSKIDYNGSESLKQLKGALTSKTLSFTQGDILLYSIFSGKNNTIITDSPTATKVYFPEFYECLDPDKQSYAIVKIGDQWWMAKNLAYMPKVSPSNEQSGIWVYDYEGSEIAMAKSKSNYQNFGCLYDWYTATNHGVNGKDICPSGWHLPSDKEWKTLEISLGLSQSEADMSGLRYSGDVANKLKSTYGWYDNKNGKNTSGFTALPSGWRWWDGNFGLLTQETRFWVSDENDIGRAWYRGLITIYDAISRNTNYANNGYSVRCVKD